ncbi:MAG: hypothetical protein RL693_1692 [Verrucomicrobiota bacterium]|jgi:hypothetical protein
MKSHRSFIAILAVATLSAADLPVFAADKESPAAAEENRVDPQAISILNRAVDKLAGAKQFSVSTEIWGDTDLEEGGRAQFTKLVDIKVRRPDHAQVDIKTSVPKRSFYYDGKTFTLLDQQKGFYGSTAAPGTIDETIIKAEEDYGVTFPLEDIMLSRPFGDGAAKTKAAQYLGVEPVLGVLCHHLAFQNDEIDWQAWVEDGPVAVVRKVVITPKVCEEGEETGDQQVIALFTKWDFNTELPDFVFSFDPPPGASKIEFMTSKQKEEQAKAAK